MTKNKKAKAKGRQGASRGTTSQKRFVRGDNGIGNDAMALIHPPIIQIERSLMDVKYFDQTRASTVITSAGAQIISVTSIAQGVAANNRIGDDLRVLVFSLKGTVIGNVTAVSGVYRIIVFQYGDNNVAPPVVSTVLTNTGSPTDYPNTTYNAVGIRQQLFSILADLRFALNQTGGPGAHTFEIEKKFSLSIAYNLAATTGTGNIYVLEVSDAAVNGPSASYVTRVGFTDA
jgi:hypothetical protein